MLVTATTALPSPPLSLPVHHGGAGLPIGTQLVGRFGGDATLLRPAAGLEGASGWTRRRPRLDH